MKKLLIALSLLATLTLSQAADVTLSYTTIQLKGVQRLVNRMNQQKVAEFLAANPNGDTNTVQTVTAIGLVQTLFSAKLDAIVAQEKRLIQQELLQKYEEADAATKTAVETSLNVTP